MNLILKITIFSFKVRGIFEIQLFSGLAFFGGLPLPLCGSEDEFVLFFAFAFCFE